MRPRIRAAALLHYVELVTELEADPSQILAEVGLNIEQISNPDQLISASAFVRALQLAALRTQRDDFGLQLGIRQDINMLGPVGLLARQCDTAQEAFGVISRYINLHNPGAAIEIRIHGKRALLCYDDITGGHIRNPQLCDLALALGQQIMQLFAGRHWHPTATFFVHKQPHNHKTHQRFFSTPLFFDQELYAIEFDASLLQLRNESGDKKLKRFFQHYVEELESQHQQDAVQVVEHLIRSLLCSGYCSEKQVALILQVTTRTLQRRLKTRGTNFKQLMHQIRLNLARQYLQESDMSFTDIAYALGYSELSAFTRFFKQQTGQSPTQFKQSIEEIER